MEGGWNVEWGVEGEDSAADTSPESHVGELIVGNKVEFGILLFVQGSTKKKLPTLYTFFLRKEPERGGAEGRVPRTK